MRDFFIQWFEALVHVLVVLMLVAVVALAGVAAFGVTPVIEGMSGPVAGLVVLIFGLLGVVFVAGLAYLGLGIYQNTKRTAELLADDR